MKRLVALSLLFLAALGCGGRHESVAPRIIADDQSLVLLTSQTGEELLARNTRDADLMPLLTHFESQRNRAYCGVASSVIVFNALGLAAPETPALGPFRYHTQETLIGDPVTATAIDPEQVNTRGMTLDQLGAILRAHSLEATVIHGADIELDAFRARIRDDVERPGDFVLVNYFRPAVGQEGGGHISPIAAYDEGTDRALVLDVAQYRYPPVWVKTEMLWSATRTIDSDSNLTRGIVEIGAPRPAQR